MAQQASPQQSSGGDHSLAPMWIMALILLALFIIWKMGHDYIVATVFYLNVLQGKFVNLFVKDPKLSQMIYLMETIDPRTVDLTQLRDFTEFVGAYVRYPVIVAMISMSILLYRSDVTARYRKKHDMKTLSEQEKSNWPSIIPVMKEDLVNTDIGVGPWAMALSPMEFSKTPIDDLSLIIY